MHLGLPRPQGEACRDELPLLDTYQFLQNNTLQVWDKPRIGSPSSAETVTAHQQLTQSEPGLQMPSSAEMVKVISGLEERNRLLEFLERQA